MEKQPVSKWQTAENGKIRHRRVTYSDVDGSILEDYEFEVFKRTWFLGSKKWQHAITTNAFGFGYGFCVKLI